MIKTTILAAAKRARRSGDRSIGAITFYNSGGQSHWPRDDDAQHDDDL
jgi:hypothetical protein